MMRFRLCSLAMSLLTLFSLSTHTSLANNWVGGAVAVSNIQGELSISDATGETYKVSAGEDVHYFKGTIRIKAASDNSGLFRASNRSAFYFQGPEYMAIERFEQIDFQAGDASERDSGQSRMIINLRNGLLISDNRALSEVSRVIVETPLGRLSLKDAWWQMEISFDERSRIYNFLIECVEGTLRFTDQQEQSYTVQSGQRLTGAGSSLNPSIEITEITQVGLERFESFSKLVLEAEEKAFSWQSMRERMEPLSHLKDRNLGQSVTIESGVSEDRRPILIEYAPWSSPLTPFRGVHVPFSDYAAGLE